MRPILMKGHERPLTFLRYNRDGDLFFSCAKDHTPTVRFAHSGDRLGTYRGHNGAVWSYGVSRDSTRLVTGSANQTAKLWDVQSGWELFTFRFDAPRAPSSSPSATRSRSSPPTTSWGNAPTAQVKRIAEEPDDQTEESLLVITGN